MVYKPAETRFFQPRLLYLFKLSISTDGETIQTNKQQTKKHHGKTKFKKYFSANSGPQRALERRHEHKEIKKTQENIWIKIKRGIENAHQNHKSKGINKNCSTNTLNSNILKYPQ